MSLKINKAGSSAYTGLLLAMLVILVSVAAFACGDDDKDKTTTDTTSTVSAPSSASPSGSGGSAGGGTATTDDETDVDGAAADGDDGGPTVVHTTDTYGPCVDGMQEVTHITEFSDGTAAGSTTLVPCDEVEPVGP